MKLTKQTVCIATEETKKKGYNVPEGFIGKYGYFFTSEQLNQFLSDVIKDTLDTAAKEAEITNKAKFSGDYNHVVDEESITDTFEETFKKFKV